jgi:tRNA threonylcarbamoyladenosine dehydratase
MGNFEDRTRLILGEGYDKIKNAKIAVLGAGGVGGYVIEMLARLGVGEIFVVDFDKFDETNLNRQILSLTTNIGQKKCDVAKERILKINPNCKVTAICKKIARDTVGEILNNRFDYVVDAIDDIKAKVEVIKFCHEKEIPLLCAMGTGNRAKMPQFMVENIWKTSYDGLARKLRNELKKENFTASVDVCYTKEQPEKTSALGSVVYYPLMCAGVMVSFISNRLLEK